MSQISTKETFRALSSRDFRLYLLARFLVLKTYLVLAVVIGQYIYQLTQDPLYLGYVGLFLFLPKVSLVLVAGSVADRYDRVGVIRWCRFFHALVALGFLLAVWMGPPPLWLLYFLLLLLGIANAFDGPANQALIPQLIEPQNLSNAVTLNSSMMQMAFILGPTLGGGLYAIHNRPHEALGLILFSRIISFLLVCRITPKPHLISEKSEVWSGLVKGVKYVFANKLILGVLSLDLFAVLLGGATALMPVYANDILHVGPWGLGILRTAMPVGALLMGAFIASNRDVKNAGTKMLVCVGLFGMFTILFGISRNFYLSLLCLVMMGAVDMVSVVVRGVIVQTHTPVEMRGRVSAVNLLFIGASNELGEFESGVTAAWWGTVEATLIGGIGTLLIVGLYFMKFPEIRKFQKLG